MRRMRTPVAPNTAFAMAGPMGPTPASPALPCRSCPLSASVWMRSQANAGKVRNIEANPRVAFHLADDGHGGDIVTIEGTASFEDAPQDLLAAYLSKYDEAIRNELKTTAEQLAADYPTTIRITPTRARAW